MALQRANSRYPWVALPDDPATEVSKIQDLETILAPVPPPITGAPSTQTATARSAPTNTAMPRTAAPQAWTDGPMLPPVVESPTPTTPAPTTPRTDIGSPMFDPALTYDYGGFQAPSYIPTAGGAAPSGWDATKWANLQHLTPKYTVGRILSNYNLGDSAQLAQAVADIQRAYPGTTWNNRDVIEIPGVGPIDFVTDFGPGGANAMAFQNIDLSGGASGTGAGGTGSGSGSGDPSAAALAASLRSTDPGAFAGPVQPVGADPLSELISGKLMALASNNGLVPGGIGEDLLGTVRGLLERGGQLDERQLALRQETAREMLDRARRTQAEQFRGDLASRNLLSEPGIPQGAEIGAQRRLEEALAPIYATEMRNILTDEMDAADTRLQTALQTATGLTELETKSLLDTLAQGTDRQAVLSNIALETLDRNLTWNMFLAQYGLQREQVLWELQNGQIDQIMPLLALFSQFASLARGGQVAAAD